MPSLLMLLLLPFLAAAALAASPRISRNAAGWLALVAPLAGVIGLTLLTPHILSGEVIRSSHQWVPAIGLDFSLRMDGLAWLFAWLVLGIGTLVVQYARHYLAPEDSARRFFTCLMLFMGAMLGMVLSGNLLLLMVFWELTSISSFLLIGFWSHRKEARDGARMALVITGGGGLALLGGVLMIGRIVGTYDLDAVLAAGDLIRAHAWYPWALGLTLLGIFTKSAQFPFHFWLPHAMAAPTPVSAYLHSATMVKAGVFLLARLHPALAGTELFTWLVCSIGATTLVIGAWNALFQHDLKGLLAYSTISHLGLITLLFGLSAPMAVVAGIFHILNHATFKAGLFMAAGIVDHETGTRDLRRLGGLKALMPITATITVLATCAMAGLPLFNGFLSKEMLLAEVLVAPGPDTFRLALIAAAALAALLGVAYSLRLARETFFGSGPKQIDGHAHDPSWGMWWPVALLAVLCVIVGIVPSPTAGPIVHTAAGSILGSAQPDYHLALWHGINTPLLISLAGIVGGIALYLGLRGRAVLVGRSPWSQGKAAFERTLKILFTVANRSTSALANGSLQRMLAALFVVGIAVGAAPWLADGVTLPDWPAPTPLPLLGWVLWLVMMICAFGALFLYRQRLLAVLVLGGTGLMVSMVFVFLSAPDLALTQLMVEMVTLVLMLLGMNYLPATSPPERSIWRARRDAVIAVGGGAGLAALAYTAMTLPQDTMAGELLMRSLPEAYGANVVNVILVDFRGFDTFGEITVFGMAALVVHALLRRTRMAPEQIMPGPPMKLPVPADLAQIMFPLTLTVSIFLFLRGHNAPGGGFIAGLVLAVPLVIQYVIQGTASVESRFGFDYIRCIGAGLLIAIVSGMASMLFGVPFLTSGHADLHLPLVGEVPLASAMGFDTGVYLVVFGGVMLILSMMGTVKPSRTRIARHGQIDPARRSARTGEMH